MKEIKFSVIVPIHGVAKYIDQCLDSLVHQDFKEKYEIICVNDAPNDDSPLIVDKYFKKYRKKIVRMTVNNASISFSRNDGMKKAKGKYICFVDGDDFVSEDFLSTFNDLIEDDKYDVVVTSYYNYIKDKVRKPFQSLFAYNKEISSKRARKALIRDFSVRGFVWNKCYKKEFLLKNEINFLDNNIVLEDITFNFMCFANTSRVIFSKKRTYFYRYRTDSISNNDNKLKFVQISINSLAALKTYSDFKHIKYSFLIPYRMCIYTHYILSIKSKNINKRKIIKNIWRNLKTIKYDDVYISTPWEEVVSEISNKYLLSKDDLLQ